MDPIPRNTIDHLADVIAAATTEKLVLVVLMLFIVLMLAVVLLAWRLLPLMKASNAERANIGHALHQQGEALQRQNDLIDALRDEVKVIRTLVFERRGWLRWFR